MPGGEHIPSGWLQVLQTPCGVCLGYHSTLQHIVTAVCGFPVALMAAGFHPVCPGGAGGWLGFCFIMKNIL